MLNGISKAERLERTLAGIKYQQEDFFYIIEAAVRELSEKELQGLYELSEDFDRQAEKIIENGG